MREQAAKSMLTALPAVVKSNVFAFLLADHAAERATGVASVIATGVASRKHRVWRRKGYHWWNVLSRQCVARVTKSINERLRLQFFAIWFIRIVETRRGHSIGTTISARSRARGGISWTDPPGSWWHGHYGFFFSSRPWLVRV